MAARRRTRIKGCKPYITPQELKQALRGQEFVLYYQPQVDIETGSIVGFEALLRWHHGVHGFVLPSQFIPLAEQTSLISPVGKWVFNEACRQWKLWQNANVPRTISVNVSAFQLQQRSFIPFVRNCLAQWEINPRGLEIELVETALIDHRASDTLQELKELGLSIAIDDFGTGYSSLSYLRTNQVDRLKIPREFVAEAPVDARHAVIVRSIVQLARDLNMDVVAEGVENHAQATFLSSVGCRLAQGFFYATPRSAEGATALLREGRIKPLNSTAI
jgi:EAL domain-containing protein (putative c-di-GMP-specific phosphodiesterase class I)